MNWQEEFDKQFGETLSVVECDLIKEFIKEKFTEMINHFPSVRLQGTRWIDAKNLDTLLDKIKNK
jgi:hypothetical protein